MDMEAVSSVMSNSSTKEEDDEAAVLPGFRFHPTDEELVGFYLKRKVEKKPFSIELIKQIDIYKFDPWDLPKGSNVGDKEWYFFCKRGRKYRNSIRPNRVTGSGFWKATGIDRPIYSTSGHAHDCIGLKKSLVYYRGSAGKGTKTDWMMHEFRLPSEHDKNSIKHIDPKTIAQEAEVWTLCRILKRNVSYRKCMPDWRELSGKQKNAVDAGSKTCSMEFDPAYQTSNMETNFISFTSTSNNVSNIASNSSVIRAQAQNNSNLNLNKVVPDHHHHHSMIQKQQMVPLSSSSQMNNGSSFHGSSLGSAEFGELLKHGDWDELRSLFESAVAASAPATIL